MSRPPICTVCIGTCKTPYFYIKMPIFSGEQEDFPIEIVKRILVCGMAAGTDPASAVNTKSNAVRCHLEMPLANISETTQGLGLVSEIRVVEDRIPESSVADPHGSAPFPRIRILTMLLDTYRTYHTQIFFDRKFSNL